MAVRFHNSVVFSVLASFLKKSSFENQHRSVFMSQLRASGSTGVSNPLRKLLSSKRKKRWYITPQPIPAPHSGFMKPAKTRRMEDSLRVRTLSMVVFKAVSDLLSSHEVNAIIPNYNVELTKVKFPADSSVCHIYWKTSLSFEQNHQIQQALDRSAPRIRYLMTSQQVLGNVPPLVFIMDKQYAALKEVENLLRVADFGPSDESSHGSETERSSPVVENRRNVFGVDHDELWKQIEDYRQKPRDSGVPSTGTREQLAALAEMRKQKLVEKKKRKEKKQRDDDITPKEFLLARQLEDEAPLRVEDHQASELMDDGKR